MPPNVYGRLAEALERDWAAEARPSQLPPTGDWRIWLLMAGRGFGKTRSGAEWVRDQVEGGHARRIALVAPTSADVRDVMIEGPSGILSIAPSWARPIYEPSKRRLTWPNGAVALAFSADEPERLRGPQHDAAWCDELAAWRWADDAWNNLLLGLRLGRNPRVCVTTTPKPIRLVRDLVARDGKDVCVTRGSTRENAENLPLAFLSQIMSRYEGTRLGRQELDAELLEDVPGALWTREMIERARVVSAPELRRVVVAIDPSGNSGAEGDEVGIIVAGVDKAGRGYVIEDLSGRMPPAEWARRAVAAYELHAADRIVAEVNFGGAMVESTLRAVGSSVAFKAVTASRGKVMRAEPISALYEQNRVSHLGAFPSLEDQMAAFTSDFDRARAGYSPDRVDALVFALTELMMTNASLQCWVEHFQSLAANKGKLVLPTPAPTASSKALPPPPPPTKTLKTDPWKNYQPARGVLYCADAQGIIANVAPEHVAALLAHGCWEIEA